MNHCLFIIILIWLILSVFNLNKDHLLIYRFLEYPNIELNEFLESFCIQNVFYSGRTHAYLPDLSVRFYCVNNTSTAIDKYIMYIANELKLRKNGIEKKSQKKSKKV